MGAAAAGSGGVTDLEGVRPRAATIQRGESVPSPWAQRGPVCDGVLRVECPPELTVIHVRAAGSLHYSSFSESASGAGAWTATVDSRWQH